MASRKGIRLPIIGNINMKSPQTWLLLVGLGLAGLWYLAQSGSKTGIGFVDKAAGQFEDIYEDYIGPLGPAGAPAPMAKPMSAAPVVPSKGMTFDDMVFSGAYATDSALPYQDWWNTSTSDDDRIIIA